jgi:hypothetical protein
MSPLPFKVEQAVLYRSFVDAFLNPNRSMDEMRIEISNFLDGLKIPLDKKRIVDAVADKLFDLAEKHKEAKLEAKGKELESFLAGLSLTVVKGLTRSRSLSEEKLYDDVVDFCDRFKFGFSDYLLPPDRLSTALK